MGEALSNLALRPQLLIEDGQPTAIFSAVAPWHAGKGVNCTYIESYTYAQALNTAAW